MTAKEFVDKLKGNGIKANEFGEYKVRMVTHYDVTREDIDYAIDVTARIVKG